MAPPYCGPLRAIRGGHIGGGGLLRYEDLRLWAESHTPQPIFFLMRHGDLDPVEHNIQGVEGWEDTS